MADDAIDIRTEFQLGGVWTDISDDVRTSTDLTITHGRADWAGQPDPCKLVLVLNNRHGRYSLDNPMSDLFDVLGRNTPARVSVPASESYLALDGTETATASTPDASVLDITGDLDVRIEATADWYATGIHNLIGKWNPVGNQRSWLLQLDNGLLRMRFSADGTATFFGAYVLPALPPRAALRMTLDVNNGAGGWDIQALWSESLSGPWIPLGAVATVPTPTSIFNSTSPLLIAPTSTTVVPNWLPIRGQVHRAEVRSGIGGTVVAAPDFRALAPGTGSFADSPGRTWTVNTPASISDRSYRFHGEIASLPSEWDPSDSDHWVTVTANGAKRRYQQGKSLLASALRRSIVREATILAYWPMEDGTAATQAYSPVSGVRPLTLTNAAWAAVDTLPASNPLPKLDTAAGSPWVLSGVVPAPAAAITGWQVRWLYRLDTAPGSLVTMMRILTTGGTVAEWTLQSSATASRLLALDADGNTVFDLPIATSSDLFGQWNSVNLHVSEAGGTVTWRVDWQDPGGDAGGVGSTFAGTIGRVRSVNSPVGGFNGALNGMSIGHVGVFASTVIQPVYDGAWLAYTGETAGARMLRLAGEESRPLATDAPVRGGRGELVGPQTSDTWMSLIEAAADADGGILYEALDDRTIRYRDRESMYSQQPRLTLDYTAPGHVMPGIRPMPDDQATRNKITVTRTGGGSGEATQATGRLNVQDPGTDRDAVGEYEDSVELSLHADSQPEQIAGWRLNLGTFAGPRFPAVTFNLRRATDLVAAFLHLIPGDRADLVNLPVGKGGPDTVPLLVQGWTETLGPYNWSAELNCTPAGPWAVGVLDDPDTGRLDTHACVLNTAVTATAISLTVDSAGTRWIDSATYPTEFPFLIRVGGEVMRVTAITGTTLAQTMTVTRSINGIVKPHPNFTHVELATPMIISL